jgi:hypothetical protein
VPPRTPARAPWDAPFPPASYSESQERRRRSCARAHYHAVYTAHRGWLAPVGSASWLAYRLKTATPLLAAVGSAVHEVASECVRAIRAGNPIPSFDVLRAAAAATLNGRWANSRYRLREFYASPKKVPVYLESLYGAGPRPSEIHRAVQTLDRAILALGKCTELWEWVAAADPSDVILMDRFTSITLRRGDMEVTCYGAADLIVRPRTDSLWRIIDFKSGRADGVVDQILTYALLAQRTYGIVLAPACLGVVVSLAEQPSEAIATFRVDEVDLDEAQARLVSNVDNALRFVANAATGEPLPMEAFPQASKEETCLRCTYRAVCRPELAKDAPVLMVYSLEKPATTGGRT